MGCRYGDPEGGSRGDVSREREGGTAAPLVVGDEGVIHGAWEGNYRARWRDQEVKRINIEVRDGYEVEKNAWGGFRRGGGNRWDFPARL